MDAATPTARSRRLPGLRRYLLALIAAVLLPLLAAAAVSTWMAGRGFLRDSSERLQETACTLAHAVDSRIDDNIALLTAFATQGPRLAEAWQGLPAQKGQLLLIDPQRPPAEVPAGLLAVMNDRDRPKLSSLYPAPGGGEVPRVAIALPPASGQGRIPVLVQPSNALIDAVRPSSHARSNLIIAVVDDHGRVAARTRDPRRWLGKTVPDWAPYRRLSADRGLFQARSLENLPLAMAYCRLVAAPGWTLVIGEPLDAFKSRWQSPLLNIAIGGALATVLALIAAHGMSRRILAPIRALSQRGRRIASGESAGLAPQPSSIREFEDMRAQIERAEQVLLQRANEAQAMAQRLARSEQRYRALTEAGALVLWRSDKLGEVISCNGWKELTGETDEQALGRGWLRRVHPDALAKIEAALQQAVQSQVPIDAEFRLLDATGHWHWVRARGTVVRQQDGPTSEWVGVLEDVDARRRAQDHAAYLAQHDPLTGLGNRALFRQRLGSLLEQARRGIGGALLFLDLDRFKEINDTLGHPLGDALLCEVARRLQRHAPSVDLIARLGGDEFAVLLLSRTPALDAAALASRLLATLAQPCQLQGHRIDIGASIGITVVEGDPPSVDRLLQNADMALYRAKEDGRGCFRFFEPGMDTRMQQRRQMELDLHQAIAEDEFKVYYQPVVDLRSRRLTGFEALLRWQHPRLGLLTPDLFLPLAEDVQLIGHIGWKVLRQACLDACQWPSALYVSVNLARQQLLKPDLDRSVLRIMEDCGLAPQQLQLEINEDTLLANLATAEPRLHVLQHAGVRIAMDDFGTGHASLGYLRAFPFDKIKIDKSFLHGLEQDENARLVLDSLLTLLARLRLASTLEGVETEGQWAQILRSDCDEGQGFLFACAMPAEQVLAWLQEHGAGIAPDATG